MCSLYSTDQVYNTHVIHILVINIIGSSEEHCQTGLMCILWSKHNTVEPPNNGHSGDEHFVHCSEVVPSSEVEMYGQLMEGGKQFGRLSSY